MSEISNQEWIDKVSIIYCQTKETVAQEAAGVGCRMATITCPCGRKRAMVKMYQCLYCKIWMCDPCAEAHFGQTVAEYREEHPVGA